MHKSKTIVLLAFVLLAVWSVTAFAAAAPKYRSADLNRLIEHTRIVGGSDEAEAAPPQRTWGQNLAVGATPPGSPGYRIGDTYYDYQHNGSQGRQVDQSVLTGHVVQATWMRSNLPANIFGSLRTVYWNKMSVAGSPADITLDNGYTMKALPLGSIGSTDGAAAVATGNRPGYTTFRNRPNGRGGAFMHDAPELGPGAFWLAGIDASAGSGVFLSNAAPSPAGIPAGSEVIWPKGTYDIVGTDTIIHAVARGSGDGDYDPIYYWRGDLNNTAVVWSTPVYIDSTATISPVIEADPTSNDVAIVYTKSINMAYIGGTAQSYNDVILRRSTDGGLTWSPRIFVHQQDTLVAGQFPYTDVSALYDDDGTLHILYNTRDYRQDAGVWRLFFAPARMIHWNDLRGTPRQIAGLDANNTCNKEGNPFTMGGWNLALAKGILTVKPAGAGGIAPEIFYAIWVQAGPTTTDCATQTDSVTVGGWVNNELWCSASSDDGLTWDRPVNITGTVTPNCTPGNCHSEHWVSAAARADSGMYLSYVDDSHAGGIVQEEGAWSLSNYMLYAPASRLPVVEPRIAVSPTSYLELHVNPSATNTVQLTVQNLGNATLNYQVQVTNQNQGQSHVTVNNVTTYNGSILAAGSPNVLTVTFDGFAPLLNPSENDWRLEVTSNDATNDPGQGGTAIDIDLNVFVASPWFSCYRDTLNNLARYVGVSSCLAIGNQGNGTGLRSLANQSEYMFEASPVLTFNSSTPAQRLSWVDMFWSGVADRSRDSNRAFRAQSSISMQEGVDNPDGDTSLTANIASGTASTTDSVFQISWQVRTFNDPGYTEGFVARYSVSKFDDPGFNGVLQFGAAADLDVDSMSAFNDGIASSIKQYVGARGGYGNDTTYSPQNKWAAMFYIPLDSLCDNQGEGGQVLGNPTYVYPVDAFHRDSLRLRMAGIVGWNAANFPVDTIDDVSVLMKNGEVTYSGAAGTLDSFAFGVAVSDVSIADLESKIGKLRSAINKGCISGCLIQLSGDVNNNTTITTADIIALVNYVLKSGLPPVPCIAAGDINCNGSVTTADIIALVNYVLKSGLPPCDICNGSPLAASCT